jgi:hypothetical protein
LRERPYAASVAGCGKRTVPGRLAQRGGLLGVGQNNTTHDVVTPVYETGGCGGECDDPFNCPYPVCILDDPTLLRMTRYEEIRRRTRDLRDEGWSIAEIAKREGCGERQIHRRLGTTPAIEARRDRDVRVRTLRAEGVSYKEIADIVGCSRSTAEKSGIGVRENGRK